MIYSPLLTFLFGAQDFRWEAFEDNIKVGDDSTLSDVQSNIDKYKPDDARMKRSTKIATYASIVRLFVRPPDRAGWVLNGVAGSCAGLHHRVPHAALRDALRLQQAIFQTVILVGWMLGRHCQIDIQMAQSLILPPYTYGLGTSAAATLLRCLKPLLGGRPHLFRTDSVSDEGGSEKDLKADVEIVEVRDLVA